jgi:hypothetical protein
VSLGDHRLIPHRGMITVSIMLATIMQALDTTPTSTTSVSCSR